MVIQDSKLERVRERETILKSREKHALNFVYFYFLLFHKKTKIVKQQFKYT